MKKRHLLFTTLALALGTFTGGSEAMAQTSWDYVYTQEETTSITCVGANANGATGAGAAGNSAWAGYDFYRVGAGGGKGGRNANITYLEQ